MSRSRRMAPVQRAISETERKRAERLAECERAVLAAETKLAELTGYHDDYLRDFTARAGAGIGGIGLRDYQVFLARLAVAIRAQTDVVERARAERDTERSSWQQAATRSKAVDQVVEQWRTQERQAENRREQKETDESAIRRVRDRSQE